MAGQRPAYADTPALWFNPPDDGESGRRTLTRERVVAEALTIIAAEGAQALSMRALAARLGVVPGALYRHVRGKEQLYDLILDAVLGEVDCQTDPAAPWAARVTTLARRLRAVLENHPGTAALLKTRDPLSPTSLELAEAFLAPLLAAGLPGREAALAFRLVYDYTLGFALADPTSPAEQRLRDTATRNNCTRSSAPCPPAASLPWPRTASTPGTATATSASPPALTPSCADCRRMSACPEPAADPDQLAPGSLPDTAAERASWSSDRFRRDAGGRSTISSVFPAAGQRPPGGWSPRSGLWRGGSASRRSRPPSRSSGRRREPPGGPGGAGSPGSHLTRA